MHNNSGVNKVFLIGHIKTEPRRHKLQNKPDTICFNLVTNEHFRKGDQTSAHEEHHSIIVCPETTDVKETELFIGRLIHVTGKLQTKSWIDENRIKRYKTEVMVIHLELLN
ncbi:single-stranded DNA-binding protein [Mucilaginibacter aquatilis]|uniref:Single-stranded DNA-binding protein n=1 Tax=Mucilaginibacter aquatilis TaxID=1517760 RepID=A0A6I4IGE9_9SPHI|nr:single-stranded DNA-binding protein [Mucilaginibacter aquatilis]MVN92708.1 single-stranded DNA-binding protein [Mucilaginibacter aquatilis]